MDLELNGKRAIVTGGSVGIGKATARELAREGVDVVICARRGDILEATAQELESETGQTYRARRSRHHQRRVRQLDGAARRRRPRRHRHPSEQRRRARRTSARPAVRVRRFRPALRHRHQGRRLLPMCQGRRAPHAEPGLGTHHQHRRTRRQERGHVQRTQKPPRSCTSPRRCPTTSARMESTSTSSIPAQPSPSAPRRKLHTPPRATTSAGSSTATEIGYVVTFLASPKSTAIAGEVVAAGGGVGNSVYQ